MDIIADHNRLYHIQFCRGIEGSHILGKELAPGFASSLLKESALPEIKALLEKITFYVFPDVSPDATEQFFRDLKYKIDTPEPDYVYLDGGTVIAGYQHIDLKWIVKGGSKYTVRVESVKGGRSSAQTE